MLKDSASDSGHYTRTSEILMGNNTARTSCCNKRTAATPVTLTVLGI
jgi:hypothetical protein